MSSHPKIPKTNAARLLEKLAIAYSLHSAPVDEEDLSAVTMAHNLGVPPQCVFKTLVARGDKTGVLMACIPANAELDLKALAAASSNKHVDMVPLKEVRPLTGYVRGGCSPLGGKKAWPVFVDASAMARGYICQRRSARRPTAPCPVRPAPCRARRVCHAGQSRSPVRRSVILHIATLTSRRFSFTFLHSSALLLTSERFAYSKKSMQSHALRYCGGRLPCFPGRPVLLILPELL